MYSENLQLRDGIGVHSKIADFIVGDPVNEDGFKYQTITLTVPFARAITPGAKLTVFDLAKDMEVVTFMAESVDMQLGGEQFLKIDGKLVLEFPKEP